MNMSRGTLSRLWDAKGHLPITGSPKFLEANHTDRVPILHRCLYHADSEMLQAHTCVKRYAYTIPIYKCSTYIQVCTVLALMKADSQFLSLCICVCGMQVYIHIPMCVDTCVCMCPWRLEVNVGNLPISHFYLRLLEAGFLSQIQSSLI